jgi:hypothetical protein
VAGGAAARPGAHRRRAHPHRLPRSAAGDERSHRPYGPLGRVPGQAPADPARRPARQPAARQGRWGRRVCRWLARRRADRAHPPAHGGLVADSPYRPRAAAPRSGHPARPRHRGMACPRLPAGAGGAAAYARRGAQAGPPRPGSARPGLGPGRGRTPAARAAGACHRYGAARPDPAGRNRQPLQGRGAVPARRGSVAALGRGARARGACRAGPPADDGQPGGRPGRSGDHGRTPPGRGDLGVRPGRAALPPLRYADPAPRPGRRTLRAGHLLVPRLPARAGPGPPGGVSCAAG